MEFNVNDKINRKGIDGIDEIGCIDEKVNYVSGSGNDSNRIIVFDTTLRDGLQAARNVLAEDRMKIAYALKDLGVDVIEAGFPAASREIYNSVHDIAQNVGTKDGPIICGLSRIAEGDIKKAAEAIEPAYNKRIHTFIATSDLHIKHKFNSSRKEIMERAVKGVSYAKKFSDDVQFSLEDFGRTDDDYAINLIEKVISAGATTINLPDTVGYLKPDRFHEKVKYVIDGVRSMNIDATFSVHTHNDRGLATATTIAGLEAGARQAEVTINGIGERAGNAALEELVFNIHRGDICDGSGKKLYVEINSGKIGPASRQVSEITDMVVQPNKAVVGNNAFFHSSGIHQDGMLKNRDTYEIAKPMDYGMESVLGYNGQSGRKAIIHKYKSLGIDINNQDNENNNFDEIANTFFEITGNAMKKPDDADFIRAYHKGEEIPKHYSLKSYHPIVGVEDKIGVVVNFMEGETLRQEYAEGNGQVDAAINAIKKIVFPETKITEFNVAAGGPGSYAEGYANSTLKKNGWEIRGQGRSTDIVNSGIEAFLDGCNRLKYIQEKLHHY